MHVPAPQDVPCHLLRHTTQEGCEESHDPEQIRVPKLQDNFLVGAFFPPLDDFGQHLTYKKSIKISCVDTELIYTCRISFEYLVKVVADKCCKGDCPQSS